MMNGGTQANKEQHRYRKHYSAIIPAEIVEDTQTGNTKIITYVGGDEYSASIAHIKKTGSGAINEYHYLHRDYLGSIMGITDASGVIKEQRQFGAWGTVDKFVDNQNNTTFTHSSLIGRGYTSHEHFFEVGLIHMNGRMYDASLSRFLSPDNYIQDPFNTQNYNRYSYVLNNPLKYVDINGENYGGTGVENGGNGWLYSLAVIVSSIFASWGEEIKNSQIGRWLNTNIGKPVERWVNKHIVNPIKKLFGSGKKNPISYDVPSMEFAGAIPSGNNLQIATSMPTSMSIGRGMNGTSDGYGDSFFERLKSLPTAIWNGDVFKEAEGVEALYPGGEIGTWFYPGGAALKAGSLFKLSKIPNAAKASTSVARLSTNGVKLTQQLASEAQMSQAGRTIISNLRSGSRLAQQYGGKAADWVKKSSSSFSKNGKTFETHWYQNVSTGQRVEFKTKLIQGW